MKYGFILCLYGGKQVTCLDFSKNLNDMDVIEHDRKFT